MPAEREKDSGAAIAVMEALTRAADAGRAVVALAHTRKGGGEDGEGVRGSSAFAGAVDVILEIDKADDTRQRTILALSRFPDTPGTTVIELTEAGEYLLVSRDDERLSAQTLAHRSRADADKRAILDALASGEPLTRAELEDAVGAPSRQWYAVLEALVKNGPVTRTGAGRKGNPYRFQILRSEAAQEDAQNGAESADAGIPFSAHPLRGAEKESTAHSQPNTAHGAASRAETLDNITANILAAFPGSYIEEAAA